MGWRTKRPSDGSRRRSGESGRSGALQEHTSKNSRTAGHTLVEILSQPRIWSETDTRLREEGALERLAGALSPRSPWLFVGCGSSYYLGRLIATLWSRHF